MKNKKATNKNIQKKAMRGEKKKAPPRSKDKGKVTNKSIQKKAVRDLKKKAPPRLIQKDKKNLEMATKSSSVMKGRKKGPRTPMLKGPLMPDATLMPETEYYQTFQLTCIIIPLGRTVIGVMP